MRATVCILALLVSACTAGRSVPHPRVVAPGVEFQLNLGERVGTTGGEFLILFERVLEDSRCPMNARCIWEGNARVAIKVGPFPGGRSSARDESGGLLELNTAERFSKRESFRENTKGLTVELRALEPTPMAGVPTQDYVATLLVEIAR
jgi:hypothetical protein